MVVPLFITHVEAIGRFLKIYGQTNYTEGIAIETAIQQVVGNDLDLSRVDVITKRKSIKIGSICLSKYSDGQYYRCKVIDLEAMDDVLVHFIDYGNDEVISMQDMISLTPLSGPNVEFLLAVAPQATEYIMAGYWNSNWTEPSLTEIRSLIVNEVVQTECYSSVRDYILINITITERDIADLSQYLIEQRGIGQVIDMRSQREQLMLVVDGLEEKDLNMGQVAYMSTTLNMHSKYEVIVSHVQEGPFLFSVQLKRDLPELQEMMTDLSKVKLQEFPTDVMIGMACLVRTDRVYRGLVTLMSSGSVVVCLVDYGSTVTVAYRHLYEIPAKFLRRKIFAIRSCIAGYKKLDRFNKQLKERFCELVMGPQANDLTINVAPLEGSAALHFCEIFTNISGTSNGLENVYDELLKIQTKFLVLAENEPVPCGFSGKVKVTWCHSPARFFVRLLLKEVAYQKLAADLNEFFEKPASRPGLTEIRIGAVCALKGQTQWYRAEILDLKKTDDGQRTAIVNLIDVGRDVEIALTSLKRLNYDFTQVPPLALECALLKVNVKENPETVAKFVRAINVQKYPQRVYIMRTYTRITHKSYLVELLDENENVMINQELVGPSPLDLDKYYLAENKVSPKVEIKSISDAVKETSDANLKQYVMPMGESIAVDLVSWVSADEFYIHLREQKKSFSEFVKTLQQVPKNPIVFDVARGTIVLVPYASTGVYYRAEVTDFHEKLRQYKVFFPDIGVRAIVKAAQLFENPIPMTKVPKFSHKCCLVDREKLAGSTSPDAVQQIGAIIKSAVDMTCIVKERLKDDLNVVRVVVDGKDLLSSVVSGGDLMNSEGVNNMENNTSEIALSTTVAERGRNENGNSNPTTTLDILVNQKVWIKAVDTLSKNVFRFSIKDMKGEMRKGVYDKGTIMLGIYVPVEVIRVENQIFHFRAVKDEILPQLLLEESFSATVCQPPTTTLNHLPIQLISDLGPVTRLLIDMRKHYDAESSPVSMDVLKQCQNQYFAIKAADGYWYRGELIEIIDAEELIFDIFDHGRVETIPLDNVRQLELKFRPLNRMSTRVYVPIDKFSDKIATEVVLKEISHLTKNISLIVKIIENYRGCWIVDLISNGFTLGQALGEKKLAITCPMAQVRKQIDRELEATQKESDKEPPPVVTRKLEPIEIGHFDSPERIFVQLKSDLPNLARMQETLQIIAPSLPSIGAAKMGELCIAQNSFDGQWYRARILDSAPDMTSVQFIDYGNTDVITTDKATKLKQILNDFAIIPEYARFCALPIRPVDRKRTEWDDEVFTMLTQFMDRPDKECEFLTETKLRRFFIRLYVQGEDLEQVLKARGWGEPIKLIRSGAVCYVSHINSLAEFYIQLDSDGTVLDLLHQYLANAETFESVAKPVVGDTYAAEFEDGDWYRAKVLKKDRNGDWEVLFVDYGNTGTVKSLKEIATKEIRDIPPLSRKCKLHMPKNVLSASMEAENMFEEIAQSGATVMTLSLVNLERDYTVIELTMQESAKNVLDLLPLNMNPYESL